MTFRVCIEGWLLRSNGPAVPKGIVPMLQPENGTLSEAPVFAVAQTGLFRPTGDVPNPPLKFLAAVADKPDR